MVRLTFQPRGGSSRDFKAGLNQTPIDVKPGKTYADGFEIVLRGPNYAPFTWQGLDELLVTSAHKVKLAAWSISPENARYSDDSDTASRRSIIRWGSTWLLLAAAAVFVVLFVSSLKAEPQAAAPLSGASYDRLLSVVIGGIEGVDAAETARVQQLLNEVLIANRPIEVALGHLRPRNRWPLLRRAKILLDQQAQRSIGALAGVQKWASTANKS